MEEFLQRLGTHGIAAFGSSGVVVLRIALILIGAWIVAGLLSRTIRIFRARIASRFTEREEIRRAETIGRVLRYVSTVVVTLLAGMLVLGELGVSVAPILGAAGVVGLAVGFGAQSLVKDYFTGFFLLLENQLTAGDVVRIADKAGVVEDVTLRFVRLRDYDGNVHFIPNNLITTVTNMSRGFAFAVVDIGIAYREETDAAVEVMRQAGREMRADAAFEGRILDDLDIAGVERLDDSAVVLRCRFRVRPLEQWSVRREFLRRLKKAFDGAGIEIPYPHVTIYAGADKQGRAPPFPVAAEPAGDSREGVESKRAETVA
jgi:moderate conductance mechanosensitive channel